MNRITKTETEKYIMFQRSGNHPHKKSIMKVGRNEKCTCGSGKKYKKCCLDKGVGD